MNYNHVVGCFEKLIISKEPVLSITLVYLKYAVLQNQATKLEKDWLCLKIKMIKINQVLFTTYSEYLRGIIRSH